MRTVADIVIDLQKLENDADGMLNDILGGIQS